jgi:hypothetical protein
VQDALNAERGVFHRLKFIRCHCRALLPHQLDQLSNQTRLRPERVNELPDEWK